MTDAEQEELIDSVSSLLDCVISAVDDESLWEDSPSSNSDIQVYSTLWDIRLPKGKRKKSENPMVKAVTLIDAPPSSVFKTYCDDDIAADYNDNCVELKHLATLSDTTKVNWCRTARIGPFKPREFVTIIENRSFFPAQAQHPLFGKGSDSSGSLDFPLHITYKNQKCAVKYASVARNVPEQIADRLVGPAKENYRSEILLSASLMVEVDNEPGKTLLMQLTSVGDVGGGKVMKTKLAQNMKKKMLVKAPMEFMERFSAVCVREWKKGQGT